MTLASQSLSPRATNIEMKALLPIIAAAFYPLSSEGAVIMTTTDTFAINAEVPDNSAVGLSDARTLSTTIYAITSVSVSLTMRDGWAGDLYAYLAHDSGFSVLLNRPGRSLITPAGSGANRIDITLTDDSLADIHNAVAASGVISGFFQPDARDVDPAGVLDTSPRSASLANFQGLDANGVWTLFIADVSSGDTMMLESWTLTVTGIPEPSAMVLVLAGTPLLWKRRREKRG